MEWKLKISTIDVKAHTHTYIYIYTCIMNLRTFQILYIFLKFTYVKNEYDVIPRINSPAFKNVCPRTHYCNYQIHKVMKYP